MNIEGSSISVFGLGYVGSVTAACLVHQGWAVIGVDSVAAKVEAFNSGRSPIVEARMDELVSQGHQRGRLRATCDAAKGVAESDISFACVATPSQRNGRLDLTHVARVCEEIGKGLGRKNSYHWVVLRSTVLPGTTRSVVIPTLERASGKRAGVNFAVCYNPEFMREGSAVQDFFEPPYTILGAEDPTYSTPLKQIYHWVSSPLYQTPLAVAEMTKYVSNAFHALKVSFANEIGVLSRQLGVDTEAVTRIFTSDTKLNISSAYLSPGFAFGGSCLPKDLSALTYRAKELDLHLPLLEGILTSNAEHIERAVGTILATNKKKVGMLGLSFKSGTDDLRESPHVRLAKRLLGEGLELRIWDRAVSLGQLVGSNKQFINDVIPHIGSLLSPSLEEVVRGVEVLVIGTKVGREELAPLLRAGQVVVDLVNLNRSDRADDVADYEGICW